MDGYVKLLGAAFGSSTSHSKLIQKRIKKADTILTAAARLPNAQDALLIIRQCAAYTRLVYATRVSPPSLVQNDLSKYSQLLRQPHPGHFWDRM